MKPISCLVAFIAFLALTACAHSPVADFVEGIVGSSKNDNPSTGARSVNEDQLYRVDFLYLLDPESRRFDVCPSLLYENDGRSVYRSVSLKTPQSKAYEEYRSLDKRSRKQIEIDRARYADREVQCAFAAFYTYSKSCPDEKLPYDQGPTDSISRQVCMEQSRYTFSGQTAREAAKDLALIIRRNQVQDSLIAVSENVCRRFKVSLNDQITKSNFAFGSTVATLAGLGAIFTDPTTARSLSGAAAIVSGVRAEYNEAYLQSLTVHVVTTGIDAKREEILEQINGHRYGPPFLESAQEVEYFGNLRPQINLDCYDDNGIVETCDATELRKRIEIAKLQSDLIAAAGGGGAKAVRYASRPYTPLSPTDKANVILQEEFTRELAGKKREVRLLNSEIQKIETRIQTLRAADASAAAQRAASEAETRKQALAALEAKTQELDTAVETARVKKEQIDKLEAKGKKRSPGENSQLEKLRGEWAALEATAGVLAQQKIRLEANAERDNAVIEGFAVDNCASDEHKAKPVCTELVNRIKIQGGICAGEKSEADKAKCDAFAALKNEQRLQCVPGNALDEAAQAACIAAGFYKKDASPQTTPDRYINDCGLDADKESNACKGLLSAIATTTTTCAGTVAAGDRELCDAFADLSSADRLKCLPQKSMPDDSALSADKAAVCVKAGLLTDGADAVKIPGVAIRSCAGGDMAQQPLCKALATEITRLGGVCGKPPSGNSAAAQCAAFKSLSSEERLQCTPGSKLPALKKMECQTAQLLQKPATRNVAAASSNGEIDRLIAEKKAKEEEVKKLNMRISTIEESFGGELAKVDALVGMVPISQYTVERAVADALSYHAACTIPAGLEQAAESVKKIQTPGFGVVKKGLDSMIDIRKAMDDLDKLYRERRRLDEEDEQLRDAEDDAADDT